MSPVWTGNELAILVIVTLGRTLALTPLLPVGSGRSLFLQRPLGLPISWGGGTFLLCCASGGHTVTRLDLVQGCSSSLFGLKQEAKAQESPQATGNPIPSAAPSLGQEAFLSCKQEIVQRQFVCSQRSRALCGRTQARMGWAPCVAVEPLPGRHLLPTQSG